MKLLNSLTFTLIALLSLTNAQAWEYTDADIELDAVDYVGISDQNRWFRVGEGSLYTAWGGHWLEYEANLTAGEWNIGLNVQNHGYLGDNWYENFRVLNSLTNEVLTITASQDTVHNGYVTTDIVNDGLYRVRFTWLNDQYNPYLTPVHDANIQVNNVFFDNTATTPSTGVPLPGTLLLLGAGLAALRRRS